MPTPSDKPGRPEEPRPEAAAAPPKPDAEAVDDWMAARRAIAPAVHFRPAAVERDEPES